MTHFLSVRALVTAVIVCLLSAVSEVAGQSQPIGKSRFNPAYGVVLPQSAGEPLRRPRLCNRPMPWPIEGSWTPDAEVISRLEARLAPALQTALADAPSGRYAKPQVSEFYRQYLGFIVAGRRIVYVNAAREQIVRGGRPEEWKTVAWNGCDGGLSLFGAEYDPATDTVHNLNFNGR